MEEIGNEQHVKNRVMLAKCCKVELGVDFTHEDAPWRHRVVSYTLYSKFASTPSSCVCGRVHFVPLTNQALMN